MTALVGILCKDGVVIGTDSSATFAAGKHPTIEQPIPKITIIDKHIIIASTGSVGLNQRFCAIVEKTWSDKIFQNNHIEKNNHIKIGKHLAAQAINDFASTYSKQGSLGALVAFPSNQNFHLCEFDDELFQPEFKTNNIWYVSMGSAQPITDPFLAFMREIFWTEGQPSLQSGIFATTWTLEHAIKVNPGGVNGPINIAVLEKGNEKHLHARMLSNEELDQHRQNVEEAKEYLRQFPKRHQPETAPDLPSIPQK